MSEFKPFLKNILKILPLVAAIAILSAHIVAVPTNSMNPTVKAGDVVIVQKTDVLGAYSELNPDDIKVGDIVVYEKELSSESENKSNKSEETNQQSIKAASVSEDNSSNEKSSLTEENSSESENKECIIHRVVSIHKSNGKKYYILKGDNNGVSDMERVSKEQLIAKAVVWGGNPVTLPQLGNIIFKIKSFLSSMGI